MVKCNECNEKVVVSFKNVRYYKGKIKCEILHKSKKKALIRYLQGGKVGNKREGYKQVACFDKDIVPIRMCWRYKE